MKKHRKRCFFMADFIEYVVELSVRFFKVINGFENYVNLFGAAL